MAKRYKAVSSCPIDSKTRNNKSLSFHYFPSSLLTIRPSCVWYSDTRLIPPFSSHCSAISSHHLLSLFLSSENLLRLNPFSLLRKWSAIKNDPATLIDYNSNTLSCHQSSSFAGVGKLFNLGTNKETLPFNCMSYTTTFLVLMD
jgi:hypothetical protein